ncbi:MAG: flavin reductase (DIM6/NTAB) family NADH-FMN oxidoreductase RutF [Halioglobus sp.]|jgi:flavin reductase (DIM6/NTAB) family NADH-FMN oxidoreductase RutF
MSLDGRDLRNALGHFATGVCVITTMTEDQSPLGMTANSFSSVSLDPPLVLWNLQNGSDVFDAFATPKYFAISVLDSSQQDLSNLYAKKGDHLMEADHFSSGQYGSPVIRDALITFECELETTHVGGDHLIVIGRVLNVQPGSEGEPLVFFSGGYRELA